MLQIVSFGTYSVHTAHVREKPLPGSLLLPAHSAHVHPRRVLSLNMTPEITGVPEPKVAEGAGELFQTHSVSRGQHHSLHLLPQH